MRSQSTAGHHLEVLFTDNGRTVEIDVDDRGAGMIADTLVEAMGKNDPGEAERLIQVGVASAGGVQQTR